MNPVGTMHWHKLRRRSHFLPPGYSSSTWLTTSCACDCADLTKAHTLVSSLCVLEAYHQAVQALGTLLIQQSLMRPGFGLPSHGQVCTHARWA